MKSFLLVSSSGKQPESKRIHIKMIIDKGVFLMVFDQLTFTLLIRQMSRKFTEGLCNKFLNKHAQHIYIYHRGKLSTLPRLGFRISLDEYLLKEK